MNHRNEKQLIVGLDIGTSKVLVVVGEVQPGEPIEVIGIGSHVTRGLKRGAVVDIESTMHSIRSAVEEAELMAGCEIRAVHASISGSHLETLNSHGTAAIRDQEVSAADVEAVLDAASAVAIPADRKLLYKEPQEYRIDGQDGIRRPVGMSGVRLEANVHLVTGAASAVQNLAKCIERCGIQVDALIPAAIASARAVLTDDERELGVCLVDIGAGTTDIAIFAQGAIRYTRALPVGGDQVTNDIAFGIHTPTSNAEEIKVKYACALPQMASAEETVQVPSVGDRPPRRLARQALAQCVHDRYEEIFEMVQDELRRSSLDNLISAGVVLTGGSVPMEGALELAEEVFHKMVRIGRPQLQGGKAEAVCGVTHAVAVGLMLHGMRSAETESGSGVDRAIDRLRAWLNKNF